MNKYSTIYGSPAVTKTPGGFNNLSSQNEESNQKHAFDATAAIEDGEGFQMLERTKAELDDVIKDLDQKLNRVLAKQEYDYLKGYNIYVKRKEKELRDLIQKLSEKNQTSTFKDDRMG